jgi:hypothetical protein
MPSLWDHDHFVHLTWPYLNSQANEDKISEILELPQNADIKSILVSGGYYMPKVVLKEEPVVKAEPKTSKPLTPMAGFTFGADPELFVKNDKGEIVPAEMIPGTKDQPYPVEHGAVQRDGFAAEYNIAPCSTFEEWNRNHKAVQGQLKNMLPKGYELVALPAVRFSPEIFDAASDDTKALGCSPDWNAWEQRLNPPPKLPGDPRLRCAGGHIHFGYAEKADIHDIQHMMNGFDLVKQLDWFLGAWSLKHDKDIDRRRLYGKAGACRIKPYGVEYRVLSNFWVLDKALRLEVWNRMVKAVESMSSKYFPESAGSPYNAAIVASINEGKMNGSVSRSFSYPINTLSPRAASAA